MNVKNPIVKDICIFCFRLSAIIPDDLYLKIVYRLRMHKKLNLNNPQRYTEKLQYMKLHDHNPLYTQLADKYAVREYVSERIGTEYLVKLYGVYDTPEEIPFDKMPEQYVIKATHDSGGCILVDDKTKLDITGTKKRLKKIMKRNFFWKGREWCYLNIKPRIICEEMLEDEEKTGIVDYKILCFHGKARLVMIATNRRTGVRFDYFTPQFEHLDCRLCAPNSEVLIEKPENFELMLQLAEKLADGIEQVRVDFYNIKGKIYFGEMTFFHFAGLDGFEPDSWDYIIGSWW